MKKVFFLLIIILCNIQTFCQRGGFTNLTPTAKGVQGATALPTQDLKDAGRVRKSFTATFTGATTEAMLTLTPVIDGVAGTAATSFVITNGKRFRVQSLQAGTRNVGAAAQGIVINLRVNTAGAAIVTSSLEASVSAGTMLAVANVSNSGIVTFTDGFEIVGNGTTQFGLSQIGTATAGNTGTLIGYEY